MKKRAFWQLFQINWTNLADSMLRRFQAYRDNMKGPNEYLSILRIFLLNECYNEILHRCDFFESYCILVKTKRI